MFYGLVFVLLLNEIDGVVLKLTTEKGKAMSRGPVSQYY